MTTPIQVQARATDPDTSHQAAAQVSQSQAQRSVQTVVRILGDSVGAMSDFEIRSKWPLYWFDSYSYTLPSKARHWARQQGLVKHAGYGTHNGRKVRLWALGKEEGGMPKSKLALAMERIAELEAQVKALRDRIIKESREHR